MISNSPQQLKVHSCVVKEVEERDRGMQLNVGTTKILLEQSAAM